MAGGRCYRPAMTFRRIDLPDGSVLMVQTDCLDDPPVPEQRNWRAEVREAQEAFARDQPMRLIDFPADIHLDPADDVSPREYESNLAIFTDRIRTVFGTSAPVAVVGNVTPARRVNDLPITGMTILDKP